MNPFSHQKNVAQGFFTEIPLEEGFIVLTFENDSSKNQIVERQIDNSFIQFHFCINGSCEFLFNNGNYKLPLLKDQSLLLYNPQRELPIHLEVCSETIIVSLLISINKFHSLFSTEANYISFLSNENKDKKYYKDGVISPSQFIVLKQIHNYNLNTSLRPLFTKGKVYELLALYFNRNEDADIEQCPFLVDESNVTKIKKAKDIIISRMIEPPSLQELADEIDLSLKKLKEGFKQIYGDSVYSFLFDYKMEFARKLLESGKYNVNEVGHKVGYSTASHFISAFKKKYGTTPKKYIMSLN
ncbi:helix-turn-helix transcriptional regulator [Ichthyenterobacterium sp. W332]|uniref:Helix-turn-helix transcriptional regulator n=1 Tax=Microcosmobacter mediterraneus TaxID=3075607 RepID=A0ABU2YI19_9FLAO|nr:helix-turn-helix transcriptional regulator [Ichthyenterobacterium sp. W332]MDT0557808.1 helix-turn-helix transcriptional regulator [Ichthyenterobacterium sp. W332]